MGSFKLRLVTYFVVLALVPLVAASWAFSEVATRSELGNTDARLNAALRVAVRDYTQSVRDDAAGAATSLAHATSVQRAFVQHNRAVLLRVARDIPHSAFYSGDTLVAGSEPPRLAARRTATVISSSGRVLGAIVVWLPLDNALLGELRANAGLEAGDRLLLATGGRVVAGPPKLIGSRELPGERPRYLELGGTTYRAVSTAILAGDPAVTLVALTPKSEIHAAVGDLRERYLLFTLAALTVVALLAWLLGRTIVRSLKELANAAGAVSRGQFGQRVPVRGRDEFAALGRAFNQMSEQLSAERGRVQDAVDRFGKALAATHDPFTLLNVIIESAVEATGAAGGRLIVEGREQARAGDPERGGRPLVIPLGPDGGENTMLLLAPEGADFGDQSRELALWLGSQASIALENVRLHRLVERQASTDGLTELANRRQFEEALANEISRAGRFGGTLALIVADLDDFKQVNDRHGHQAGDDVLRTFADVLRETVRDIDVAARYGGEEFAVLLPQTDLAGAERLAERLRETLGGREIDAPHGIAFTVTASFGVASFPEAGTAAALFAAADEALYRAKSAGKNCVVCADANGAVRAPR
ncbi:MAG TPA: diguanylate cyclase [Gaiellaceae bacterium]|jgi:diguanylate cyclase (GGDEF)-like protein|nr:diguanylate cyclase [Gaiellaceae bacterium]